MRAFILFLTFLGFLFPVAGMAAEVYIHKDTGKIEVTPEGVPEEQAPADINAFANAYYQNCTKKEHPIIKGEDLQMLCACTAAKIPDVMNVEQMEALQTNTSEGQYQRNRMLMFVYTPCIEYPVVALVKDSCMNNPKIKTNMSEYKKVCSCLADHMAEFVSTQAPKTIEAALKRDPRDIDPLALLVNGEAFERQSAIHMKECLLRHQFGMLE